MSELHLTRGRRWREQAREEGRQEGREEGERDALVRLAGRRFGWEAGQRLADALGDHPDRVTLTQIGDLILTCETTEEFVQTQVLPTRVRLWLEHAREEGRGEGREEGERNALVELAGKRFGGVAGERLAGALDARPGHEMVTQACDLILACDTTEEFIYSLGGPHEF